MNGLPDHGRRGSGGRGLLRTSGLIAGAVVAGATWMAVSTAACDIGLGEDLAEPSAASDAAIVTDGGAAADAAAVPREVESYDGGAILGSGDGTYPNAPAVSPLCGVSASSCDPDDGVCTAQTGPGSLDAGLEVFDAAPAIDSAATYFDAALLPDTGVGSLFDAATAAPDTGLACHVTAVPSEAGSSAVPVCSPAGKGKDDAQCSASSDCAPSFECVQDSVRVAADGAPAAGVCRRYCCDNTCSNSKSFCDIEATVNGSAVVPVCVVRPASDAADGGAECQLLEDATCGAGSLTCQVASDGAVACVSPGTSTAGQSCETNKCAAGLSCVLGYFPERTCAQLCKLESDDCPPTQKCTQNATVTAADAMIGVCTQES